MTNPKDEQLRCPPDPYIGSLVAQEDLMTIGYTFLISQEAMDKAGISASREVLDLAMQLIQTVLFDSQETQLFEFIEQDPQQLA